MVINGPPLVFEIGKSLDPGLQHRRTKKNPVEQRVQRLLHPLNDCDVRFGQIHTQSLKQVGEWFFPILWVWWMQIFNFKTSKGAGCQPKETPWYQPEMFANQSNHPIFPSFGVFGVKKTTNISSSYRIFRNILMKSCENGHSNHHCSVYATQKPTQLPCFGWIPRYCSMDLCAAFTPRFKAVAPGWLWKNRDPGRSWRFHDQMSQYQLLKWDITSPSEIVGHH